MAANLESVGRRLDPFLENSPSRKMTFSDRGEIFISDNNNVSSSFSFSLLENYRKLMICRRFESTFLLLIFLKLLSPFRKFRHRAIERTSWRDTIGSKVRRQQSESGEIRERTKTINSRKRVVGEVVEKLKELWNGEEVKFYFGQFARQFAPS